jgi:UDP-glucuronate 4-epimerase
MSKKNYLITGCAGFIGSALSRKLIDNGHNVIGVDNLNDYYDVRLKDFRLKSLKNSDNFHFYKIDIENKSVFEELFKKYDLDGVYNLAARAGVRYSLINPHVYFSTNVDGYLNILELCRENNVERVFLASSSSLYAGNSMPFDESLRVDNPLSPYAASKKAAELLGHTYHHLYKLKISVGRFFTVYGPAGRPDMAVLRFMNAIDQGKTIELYGDGTQSRDFTFIDDIVDGTIKCLEKTKDFQVYNLGGGCEPTSVNDLINLLEENLDKKVEIRREDFNHADMMHTKASIDKAKNELGWIPKTDLSTGLKLTCNEYKMNRDLYSSLS